MRDVSFVKIDVMSFHHSVMDPETKPGDKIFQVLLLDDGEFILLDLC
jgi:hypothetical protein